MVAGAPAQYAPDPKSAAGEAKMSPVTSEYHRASGHMSGLTGASDSLQIITFCM